MTHFFSTFRQRIRLSLGLIALLTLATIQPAFAAQTKVYEWRDARGVLSYSQQPPPSEAHGRVTTREIDTKTFTPSQRIAITAHLAGIDAIEAADAKRFRGQVASADQSVTAALRQLADAERALRNGRAPGAGERIGNAGGGSRLRAEYFDRQKRLEVSVQTAHAKFDEAYRLREGITP